MLDFQVQYGLAWVLVIKIRATRVHFLGYNFSVDFFSPLVLAGYFHFKSSIRYITFNELSKNGLSKRENWFETTTKIKILFLSYESVHT